MPTRSTAPLGTSRESTRLCGSEDSLGLQCPSVRGHESPAQRSRPGPVAAVYGIMPLMPWLQKPPRTLWSQTSNLKVHSRNSSPRIPRCERWWPHPSQGDRPSKRLVGIFSATRPNRVEGRCPLRHGLQPPRDRSTARPRRAHGVRLGQEPTPLQSDHIGARSPAALSVRRRRARPEGADCLAFT